MLWNRALVKYKYTYDYYYYNYDNKLDFVVMKLGIRLYRNPLLRWSMCNILESVQIETIVGNRDIVIGLQVI